MKPIYLTLIVMIAAVFFIWAASANGVYYVGDPITLKGTNPNTYEVYLYISGPNMPLQEIPLRNGGYLTTADNPLECSVDDRQFETTFYLANNFDASTYQIFVTIEPLKYSDKGKPYVKYDDNLCLAETTITLQGISSSSFGSTLGITETPTAAETQPSHVSTTATQTSTPQPTASPFLPAVLILAAGALSLSILRKN